MSGLSPGTILEAYHMLEDSGRIEARAGSGYFVKSAVSRGKDFPRPGRLRQSHPARLDPALDLAINLENRPLRASFGLATPAAELLPLAALKKQVTLAMRREGSCGYSFVPGLHSLRREIAVRLVHCGVDVGADDVIVTAGGTESLFILLSELTRPGEWIAMESPVYAGFVHIARLLGLRIVEIPVDQDGLSTRLLEHRLESGGARPSLIVTNPTYQNPTGSTLSTQRRDHLLALARKHHLNIIEDDVYSPLHFGPRREAPLISSDRERVFLFSSFSKIVGPCFKVGWIVAPEKYRERLTRRMRTLSLGNSRLLEETLAGFLASGGLERHLRRFRRECQHRVHSIRDRIIEAFPAGTRIADPSGGFLLWVELPPTADALAIQKQAVERGITISPGPIHSPSGGFGHYIRLNCAVPFSPSVLRAVDTLAALVP